MNGYKYKEFKELDYLSCENLLMNFLWNSAVENTQSEILYNHLVQFIPNYNKQMLYITYKLITEISLSELALKFEKKELETPNLITSKLKELYYIWRIKNGQIFNKQRQIGNY